MRIFAKAVDGGLVEGFEQVEPPPDTGPPPEWYLPHIDDLLSGGYIEVTGGWPLPPRPNTHARPFIADGVVQWGDPRDLVATSAAAISKTYLDVDSVYEAAVGQRTVEYASAEEAARACKAAGFPVGDDVIVSDYISGFARSNPTLIEQTNEWAARQIIERADAFRWAKLNLRVVRGDRQKEMRLAATLAELDAVVASWDEFITWLRVQLGI